MFLTPDELVTLTGFRRPSRQIEWLRARRIRHYVNGVGHPIVAKATIIGTSEPAAPRLRLVRKAA